MLASRLIHGAALVAVVLTADGCLFNPWHTESYFDELTYPAPNAATAIQDEKRIIAFIPTIGFKRDDPVGPGPPKTEAVFIRSDNDHFHVTVTVRTLARIDQPGFVTVVHVDSYNIGQEGAIQAGKSVLNEIDQLYRRPQPLLMPVPATGPSNHS